MEFTINLFVVHRKNVNNQICKIFLYHRIQAEIINHNNNQIKNHLGINVKNNSLIYCKVFLLEIHKNNKN